MKTFGEETTKGFKMDPELKAKWVEALRSGRYKQGRRCLGDGEYAPYYCCLGVLNKVAGLGLPGNEAFLRQEGGDYLVLPFEVQRKLVRLNDMRQLPFSEIADYIEENL